MSKNDDVRIPSPNFWFCFGAAMLGLAVLIWPSPGDYFGQYWLAYALVILGVGGVLRGVRHLRIDFWRRRMAQGARVKSGKFGKAHFASLKSRLKAGVHNPAGKMLLGMCGPLPAFLPDGYHLACQAPPGAGKSSALVAGAIYHAAMTGRSVVVNDVKPEFYHLWTDKLRELGFRVVVDNPGRVEGIPHNGDSNPFGPLVDIMKDPSRHGEAFIYADNLSRSLIKEIEGDKNAFFKENDRAFFVVMAVTYAALYPDLCYPSQIWRALVDPRLCRDRLFDARESDVLGGDLSALAASLLQKEVDNADHYENGRTGASQALSVFRPSSLLGAVGASNNFRPEMLRDEVGPPTILLVIVPSDKVPVFSKPNALKYTAYLQSLKQQRTGREVLFLMDEATNLPIPTIAQEIELLRSYKIPIAVFYQSDSSLQKTYGKEGAASIKASSVEVYFNVGDAATAKDISERIGDITIKTDSYTVGEDGKPSRGTGETSRRLMPPEEILAMRKDQALVLIPGMRPIKLTKTPFYLVEPYKSLAGANPHEKHPPSEHTMLTLEYGRDASELGAPVIPDLKKRMRQAEIAEAALEDEKPVPFVRLRSLLWAPIIAGAFAAIALFGTPHMIFEYQKRPGVDGTSRCVYVGLSGVRPVRVVGSCPRVRFFRRERQD